MPFTKTLLERTFVLTKTIVGVQCMPIGCVQIQWSMSRTRLEKINTRMPTSGQRRRLPSSKSSIQTGPHCIASTNRESVHPHEVLRCTHDAKILIYSLMIDVP